MQTQCNASPKQSGFTLVELMIVVAIAGVLTAVAYPSYRAQVNKGYVADAQSELSNTAFDMEQAYQENRTYQDPDVDDTCAVANFSTDNFSFSCSTNSKTTYLWTISFKNHLSLDHIKSFRRHGRCRQLQIHHQSERH